MDTILLIKDPSTLTKVLTTHLQRAGYRVVAASNAFEGYEACIRQDVHLVFADFTLSDRSGPEVIAALRARQKDLALPIIALTDSAQDYDNAEACKEAGASLVLSKADGPRQMLEKIEELIVEYKANRPSRSIDGDMGVCITKATCDVFRTMMNLEIEAGEAVVEKVRARRSEVIGSIGVAGFLSGSISIFLSTALAKKASIAILMLEEDADLDHGELVDAMGELINMVGTNIKTELFQKTPLFNISIPSVYTGYDLERRAVSDDLCFLVPFKMDGMEFSVEFLMVTRPEGGGAGVQQSLVDSLGN